jgi:heme-degrading monooxygenase HmoA
MNHSIEAEFDEQYQETLTQHKLFQKVDGFDGVERYQHQFSGGEFRGSVANL